MTTYEIIMTMLTCLTLIIHLLLDYFLSLLIRTQKITTSLPGKV